MITFVMIMTFVMTKMTMIIREGIEEGKKKKGMGINFVIIRLPRYTRSISGSLLVYLLPKYV